jgi:hypothetical protein
MNRNWMMIWPTTSRPPRFEQYLTQKKRVCPPQFLLDSGQRIAAVALDVRGQGAWAVKL